MSFILDALKKSENERQRQHGPVLADVPLGQRKSPQPWWVIGVAVLLIANLGVLLFVLLRRQNEPAAHAVLPAAAAVPAATASAPPPASMPTVQNKSFAPKGTGSASANVRPLAEEAAPAPEIDYESVPASAQSVPDGPSLVRPLNRSQVSSEVNGAPAETVPTINDVGGPSAAGLAELHLDVHVYSQQSTARFVFINTRKYVEGQVLAEGPTVDKITPEGAILSYRGRRFLLPRQ